MINGSLTSTNLIQRGISTKLCLFGQRKSDKNLEQFTVVFLFLCSGCFVPLEIFSLIWRRHHFRWRTAILLTMVCSHCHWTVRIFLRATPTVTRGVRLLRSSPSTCETHTFCRAFSSGAVTIYFQDLGLSRVGYKTPNRCFVYHRRFRTHYKIINGNVNFTFFNAAV